MPPRARLADVHEQADERRIDVALAQVRDCREGRLRRRGCSSRLVRRICSARRAAGELVGLVGEAATARVHLEENRFGGLPREPELASLGVVAMPFGADHRSVSRVEQPFRRDEPDAVQQAKSGRAACHERAKRPGALDRRRGLGSGFAIEDDREAAEPIPAGPLEQLEPVSRIASEHRGSTPRQRRGDGALGAGFGLEGRKCQCLPGDRERARRRGDSLSLRQRPLERLEALVSRPRPFGDVVALGGSGTCRCRGVVCLRLELGRCEPSATGDRTGLVEVARERLDQVAVDSSRRPMRSRAVPRATRRRLAPS